MKCEICESAQAELALPMRNVEGEFPAVACSKCAFTQSCYCKEHGKVHCGFPDGTTACLDCVEEIVRFLHKKASLVFSAIQANLPAETFEKLKYVAEEGSSLGGGTKAVVVFRYITTKVFRTNKSPDAILDELIQSGDLNTIIPQPATRIAA